MADGALNRNRLTAREVEVLRLIAAGRTNREIADRLISSVPTVERHSSSLYTKINARGRADATADAFSRGLIDLQRSEPVDLNVASRHSRRPSARAASRKGKPRAYCLPPLLRDDGLSGGKSLAALTPRA